MFNLIYYYIHACMILLSVHTILIWLNLYSTHINKILRKYIKKNNVVESVTLFSSMCYKASQHIRRLYSVCLV